jgi:predicted nucleic acid-binding protein
MAVKSSKLAVIDASFVLGFLLPDEHTSNVDIQFNLFQQGKIEFISSPILPFEVLNGIRSAIKQKRINTHVGKTLTDAFLMLDIPLEPIHYTETMHLALTKNLSVYDAGYIWLAKKKRIPLFTLDNALK